MSDPRSGSRATAPHVMAQLAGCRRAVGIALSSRPRLFELRGAATDLQRVAGDLDGQGAASGHCVPRRCGWWEAKSRHRLLVLADPSRHGDFDRLLSFVAASRSDIAVRNVSAGLSSLVLVGPLAASLAAARVAEPVMVAVDDEHCRLLVLPACRAEDAKRALLQAGRDDGALAVDVSAVHLYRAARRIVTAHQPAPDRLSFDPTSPGALLP